ncbi:MAG: hypothetical protein ACLFST_06905 [Spirochaetia bacterium]
MRAITILIIILLLLSSCVTNPILNTKPPGVAETAVSGIFPGIPQFLQGETVEGIIYSILGFGSLGVGIYLYADTYAFPNDYGTYETWLRRSVADTLMLSYATAAIISIGDGGVTAEKRLKQWEKNHPIESERKYKSKIIEKHEVTTSYDDFTEQNIKILKIWPKKKLSYGKDFYILFMNIDPPRKQHRFSIGFVIESTE